MSRRNSIAQLALQNIEGGEKHHDSGCVLAANIYPQLQTVFL